MKYRIRKKIAKRYLNGDIKVSKYLLGKSEYWHSSNFSKEELKFPKKLEREILRQARLMGWDGCHWNSPILIAIYDCDNDVTYYRFGAYIV